MEEIKIEKLEFYILKILKQLKTELYLNTSNVKVKEVLDDTQNVTRHKFKYI